MGIEAFSLYEDDEALTKKEKEDFYCCGPATHIGEKNTLYLKDGYFLTDWKLAQKIIKGLIRFYSLNSENDINILNQKIRDQLYQSMNMPSEPKQKPSPVQGYVYFLQAFLQANETKTIKIGKTLDLKNRFDQIQPKLPFETKAIYIIKTTDYTILEKKFHELYDAKRGNGEWFELTDIDVEDIKNKNLPQDILNLIIKESE